MKSIVHAVCVGYICVASVGVLVKCQMVWHRVENYMVFIVLTSFRKTIGIRIFRMQIYS